MRNADEAKGDEETLADGVGESPEGQETMESRTTKSSFLLSGLVLISRITGFMRTWVQALAIGVTPLASCYTVANNLPSQLYELVVGGMLVTAFLPVYMSVKKERGHDAASRYASNLTGIVGIGMLVVTVLSILFASQVVWTQSFSATEGFDFDRATWFFRFFAIEMVLYSLSSIFSGVLNAERDYLWSGAAPIANNMVAIGSFVAYMLLVGHNPSAALLALALGNPLGVLAQVLLQMPALKARGVRIRPVIDLHDPYLRDTLSIGVPSIVVMVCSFLTVSVQTSSALYATASGASVAAYARLWYTLPYAIFIVPITTTLFTELSDRFSADDHDGWRSGVSYGMGRILLISVPLAMLLAVFAFRLVALIGPDFSPEDSAMTAHYLRALAVSLPLYGICMYLQKVCSSVRRMKTYAVANVLAAVVQIAVCLALTPVFGLQVVAYSSLAYFASVDIVTLAVLRRTEGRLGLGAALSTGAKGFACGLAGSLVGVALQTIAFGGVDVAPQSMFSVVIQCLASGIPALVACAIPLVLMASKAGITLPGPLERLSAYIARPKEQR